MYYQVYPYIPMNVDGCDTIRFWVGFFALDCFIESFCCLWMAMGGYTDSCCMFAFGWILHLLVALPYCISTVGVPISLYSDGGKVCRDAMGPGQFPLVAIYWTHCGLFVVYVWMMLSITYYSFVKATFFKKSTIGVES
jgi:hypothetical protein